MPVEIQEVSADIVPPPEQAPAPPADAAPGGRDLDRIIHALATAERQRQRLSAD